MKEQEVLKISLSQRNGPLATDHRIKNMLFLVVDITFIFFFKLIVSREKIRQAIDKMQSVLCLSSL